MALVHLVADFARIATVREKRRSMILAVVRSARQVARHPLQSMGVFAVMILMLGLCASRVLLDGSRNRRCESLWLSSSPLASARSTC